MKKIIAILLALAMVLSLAACGNTDDDKDTPNNGDNQVENNDPNGTPDVDTPAEGEDDTNPLTSAVDAINRIWEVMPEDFKPMTFGGETESEEIVENAAAAHSIGDGTRLDADFGYPAGMIDKISEAAALRHMMNVNSFTCGAYALNDSADAQAVADGITDALMNRSYLCGAPQWLVVMSVQDSFMSVQDSFIVSAFGAEDIINAFKEAAVSVYGDRLTVLCDQSMEGAHGDNGIALGGIGIGF